jgi:hypothetical protein
MIYDLDRGVGKIRPSGCAGDQPAKLGYCERHISGEEVNSIEDCRFHRSKADGGQDEDEGEAMRGVKVRWHHGVRCPTSASATAPSTSYYNNNNNNNNNNNCSASSPPLKPCTVNLLL